MLDKTTEFSFVLKSVKYGIGVFAAHDIKEGAHLRLFGDRENIDLRSIIRSRKDVPEEFRQYCMDRGDKLVCPEDFGQMHVGWYLNHSNNPNTKRDKDYKWYASQNIKTGEEITINYNSLEEPEEAKEDFYKNV